MTPLRRRIRMFIIYFIGIILITWAAATYYVEQEGKDHYKTFEVVNSTIDVLYVFDPDPIYNLDLQLSEAMGNGFNEVGANLTVASVSVASNMDLGAFDLIILCANTYNWRPDRVISKFIKKSEYLVSKPVAALTLGAGSTGKSSELLIQQILARNAVLISSESIWLMKPNDENQLESSNVEVAKEKAYEWSKELMQLI